MLKVFYTTITYRNFLGVLKNQTFCKNEEHDGLLEPFQAKLLWNLFSLAGSINVVSFLLQDLFLALLEVNRCEDEMDRDQIFPSYFLLQNDENRR